MADEILLLAVAKSPGSGAEKYSLLFFYDIASPISVPGVAGSTKVIPTPWIETGDDQSAPQEAVDFDMVATAKKTAIAAGDMAFATHSITKNPGDTNAQVLAKAQSDYVIKKAEFLADYVLQYTLAGTKRNA